MTLNLAQMSVAKIRPSVVYGANLFAFILHCSIFCYGDMFAFVVFDLVLSVLSQETGYQERLRNDLFCVGWDIKPLLT